MMPLNALISISSPTIKYATANIIEDNICAMLMGANPSTINPIQKSSADMIMFRSARFCFLSNSNFISFYFAVWLDFAAYSNYLPKYSRLVFRSGLKCQSLRKKADFAGYNPLELLDTVLNFGSTVCTVDVFDAVGFLHSYCSLLK